MGPSGVGVSISNSIGPAFARWRSLLGSERSDRPPTRIAAATRIVRASPLSIARAACHAFDASCRERRWPGDGPKSSAATGPLPRRCDRGTVPRKTPLLCLLGAPNWGLGSSGHGVHVEWADLLGASSWEAFSTLRGAVRLAVRLCRFSTPEARFRQNQWQFDTQNRVPKTLPLPIQLLDFCEPAKGSAGESQ